MSLLRKKVRGYRWIFWRQLIQFKGSASSLELNQAVLKWVGKNGREEKSMPIADGGENTAEAIYYALGEHGVPLMGWILLFRQRKISYLLTTQAKKYRSHRICTSIGVRST